MHDRPHVLFLFLDGVGIGKNDAESNPFFSGTYPALQNLLGGSMPHLRNVHRKSSAMSLVPILATLGVAGLPQSGTGQTSLMTGVNAARVIGKHFGPYPYSTLRPMIREKNLFHRLQASACQSFYANAFPQQFFDHLSVRKHRIGAMTMCWLMSGFRLNDSAALRSGKALSADLTNERWPEPGVPSIPVITPHEAGKRLAHIARENNFVLFEYYLTDVVGHRQSMEEAVTLLTSLDAFIEGILSTFDYSSMLLIITSDHGNVEDLSTRTHTRNPVPLLCVGHRHQEITQRVKNLTQFVPAVVALLQ